jgi:hypothetical protein
MVKKPASAYATFRVTLCTRTAQRVAACIRFKRLDKSPAYRSTQPYGRYSGHGGSARKSAEARLGHNFVWMTSLADPLSPYRVEEHRQQSVC